MALKVLTPGGDGIGPEVISNTDLIVIRELCGGAMFSPTQGSMRAARSNRTTI